MLFTKGRDFQFNFILFTVRLKHLQFYISLKTIHNSDINILIIPMFLELRSQNVEYALHCKCVICFL